MGVRGVGGGAEREGEGEGGGERGRIQTSREIEVGWTIFECLGHTWAHEDEMLVLLSVDSPLLLL